MSPLGRFEILDSGVGFDARRPTDMNHIFLFLTFNDACSRAVTPSPMSRKGYVGDLVGWTAPSRKDTSRDLRGLMEGLNAAAISDLDFAAKESPAAAFAPYTALQSVAHKKRMGRAQVRHCH